MAHRKCGRGRSSVVRVLALCLAVPAAVAAQEPELSFTGRVHAQMATSSVDGAKGSEFIIRRARVTASLRINDWISARVQPEFAGGSATLRDAWVKMAFDPAFEVTFGQLKQSFDLFAIESSTRNLTIERTGKIAGAGSCAGVGGACAYSRFMEKLQYADRDIGMRIDGQFGDSPVSYSVSITNGAGQNKTETDGEKAFAGRLEFELADNLVVSPNVSLQDYTNEVDPTKTHGTAWGVDLDWGAYAPGLHVQAAAAVGDNWKSLDVDGEPTTFATAQGVLSYRFAVENNTKVTGVEPVARITWGDPDRDLETDSEMIYTAGFIAHFTGRNRIALNLDVWDGPDGESAWGLKLQTYMHF